MGKYTSNEDRLELIESVVRRRRPIKEAAKCLNIKYTTALNILRQFQQEDRCHKLKNSGAKIKFGEEFNEALTHLITQNPRITLKECQDYFKYRTNEFNNNVPSMSTINRIVNSEGFAVKKLDRVPIERNEPPTIELRKGYAAKYSGLECRANFVFVNEFGYDICLRRGRGRNIIGPRAYADLSSKLGSNISICAAMDISGPIHHVRKLTGFDTLDYISFFDGLIEKLSCRDGLENYLLMDSDRFHKSEVVIDFLREKQVKFFFTPPYSPMLNPIEGCFTKVEAFIKEAQSMSSFDLFKAIDDGFETVTASDCVWWFEKTKKYFPQCLSSRPIYVEPNPNEPYEKEQDSTMPESEDEFIDVE